ncbi:hypothetical protein M0813_06086 [Anaeramoeba flamelloides]|uniref:Uncharacterized protein n=1 Tax=Anaeramoeba flamelloides TaxID=1746091 RepID=A0ABQ8XFE0_9EUKA|nr:hypothetical protein M0813_06086 [Anaeramoeba flamelloides]
METFLLSSNSNEMSKSSSSEFQIMIEYENEKEPLKQSDSFEKVSFDIKARSHIKLEKINMLLKMIDYIMEKMKNYVDLNLSEYQTHEFVHEYWNQIIQYSELGGSNKNEKANEKIRVTNQYLILIVDILTPILLEKLFTNYSSSECNSFLLCLIAPIQKITNPRACSGKIRLNIISLLSSLLFSFVIPFIFKYYTKEIYQNVYILCIEILFNFVIGEAYETNEKALKWLISQKGFFASFNTKQKHNNMKQKKKKKRKWKNGDNSSSNNFKEFTFCEGLLTIYLGLVKKNIKEPKMSFTEKRSIIYLQNIILRISKSPKIKKYLLKFPACKLLIKKILFQSLTISSSRFLIENLKIINNFGDYFWRDYLNKNYNLIGKMINLTQTCNWEILELIGFIIWNLNQKYCTKEREIISECINNLKLVNNLLGILFETKNSMKKKFHASRILLSMLDLKFYKVNFNYLGLFPMIIWDDQIAKKLRNNYKNIFSIFLKSKNLDQVVINKLLEQKKPINWMNELNNEINKNNGYDFENLQFQFQYFRVYKKHTNVSKTSIEFEDEESYEFETTTNTSDTTICDSISNSNRGNGSTSIDGDNIHINNDVNSLNGIDLFKYNKNKIKSHSDIELKEM